MGLSAFNAMRARQKALESMEVKPVVAEPKEEPVKEPEKVSEKVAMEEPKVENEGLFGAGKEEPVKKQAFKKVVKKGK